MNDDNLKLLEKQLKDLSTLKTLLRILSKNASIENVSDIKVAITDAPNNTYRLHEYRCIGLSAYNKEDKQRIYEELQLKGHESYINRYLMVAINACRKPIIESMITQLEEDIRETYNIINKQMCKLFNIVKNEVDRDLAEKYSSHTYETKVLTNKYAEGNNEEMSPAQP